VRGLVEINKIYSDTDLLSIPNFQIFPLFIFPGTTRAAFSNLVLIDPDGRWEKLIVRYLLREITNKLLT